MRRLGFVSAVVVLGAAHPASAGQFEWVSASATQTDSLSNSGTTDRRAQQAAERQLGDICRRKWPNAQLSRVSMTGASCQRQGDNDWTCTATYEGLCEAR